MELQSVDDFHEYIDRLKERKENCTIIIAGADDYVSGMTETDYDLLRELGLNLIKSFPIYRTIEAWQTDLQPSLVGHVAS